MLIRVKPGMVFDFAEVSLFCLAVEQEIHPGHARAVDSLVCAQGDGLQGFNHAFGDGGRDDQLRAVILVFGVVAVESSVRDDFTRDRAIGAPLPGRSIQFLGVFRDLVLLN